MKYLPVFKATFLAASLVGLTACSSNEDSGDDVQSVDDSSITDEDSPDEDGDVTDDDVTDDGGDDTNLTGLLDPVPNYPIIACGDLPVSVIDYSNLADAPANMTTNMIVGGRIDPGSSDNQTHYWTVDLQPGYYHLVLDRERLDRDPRSPGVKLTDLNGSEEEVVLNTQDYGVFGSVYGVGVSRTREHDFLEITEARTLQIRAESIEEAEDYTFALFENGTAVPSPFFNDCPVIQTLSPETTETITLPESVGDGVATTWLRADLEAQDYQLNLTATRTDGRSSNIILEAESLDLFGQFDRFEELGSINEIDISVSGSFPIRRSEDGPVWIQLRNDRETEYSVDVTLQTD